MAINERLIHTAAADAGNEGTEGLILHLDANDVDSYDGDGTTWYDITDHEYVPTANPEEHFNTVTFTSTGVDGASAEVTGVGFQSDLVWIKGRNYAHYHRLTDSVRGVDKALRPDTTDAEQSSDDFATLSFNADGFNYRDFQESDETLVAWCFKAGGAPTATNTGGQTPTSGSKVVDGSTVTDNYPTSSIYPKKQTVNTKLGFSITNYTGTLSSTQTKANSLSVPHGLGVPVEMIIWKRTQGGAWSVWHKALGNENKVFDLHDNGAYNDYSSAYPTQPHDSNHFYTNWITSQNVNTGNHIAYCFASKRGVSKVGSYTGTGTSGNKIHTGFEPAWVMIKNTSGSSSWMIYDIKRDTDGTINKYLEADTSDTEASASTATVSPNRDGFTLGNSNSVHLNKSGNTFVYLAFAKNTKETELVPTAGNFTEGTVTSGAVIEYNANDSTDFTDQAGSNNGTVTGSIPHTDNTNSGDFWTFDGYDLVDTGFQTSDLTTAGEISIEMWVRPDDVGSRTFFFGDFDANGADALGSLACEIDQFDNLEFRTGDGTLVQIEYPAASFSKYRDGNTWFHLVAAVDNSTATLFIDGEVVAQGTTATMKSNTTYNIAIGAYSTDTSTLEYQGDMGLVRIYNKHLTLAEVRANYDATYGLYQYADLEIHLDPANTGSYSGSGTTYNDLANSNDFTISNATYDEEVGDFFTFDGTGDSITSSASSLSLSAPISIEGWVNMPDVSAQQCVWSKYKSGTDDRVFSLYNYAGTLYAISYYESGGGGNTISLTADNVLKDGKWHHFVHVIDGSVAPKLYIDGELAGTGSSSNTNLMDYPAIPIKLGNFTNGAAAYDLDGKIGQFRLYNTALTQAQVRQNFNFTKSNYPNGFNGTLTNMSSSDWNSSGYFSFTASNDAVVTDYTPRMTEPFTMSVWVDQNTNSNTYNTIFGCTQASSPYSGAYFFRVSNGDFIMAVNGGTDVTVGTPSAAGTFDHLVFVYYGGTSCRTFINGVGTDRTLNNAITQPSSSTYVRIGDSGVSGWNASIMDVSDAKFFSKALTDDEVTAEFNKGYDGNN